ncbi:MAG: helix-turn-helix domain-containing protein [Oscillospiraceae bacterium]|nr:helix-turn-helix transcriptional regulator [Ruminococcus sp.]MDE6708194.1 helix-turn-helix domain-containing protein [Oscillospiraceae bacterium]
MTITERIFVVLAQKKMSQKEFAKRIEVNEKTVSAWKKNNSLPPVDKIYEISDCLGVTTDYLLTGEEKNTAFDISHSAVGAVGESSQGTVNIHTDSKDNSNTQNHENLLKINSLDGEALNILHRLPMKEQFKLLAIMCEFEEEYLKQSRD